MDIQLNERDMKILFTAAEQDELDCAIKSWGNGIQGVTAEFHLTGIGSAQACHRVTSEILKGIIKGEPYDCVVNIGIAGSYNLVEFPIGSAALISQEHFGDLGFETETGFKDLFQYGILGENDFPYTNGALKRPELPFDGLRKILEGFKEGIGVTVQTVTGDPDKVEALNDKYKPHIESMEGAAVYYAALLENIPVFEVRSVSNAVGERDKTKWDIPAALNALEECCRKIMVGLDKKN